MIPTSPTTSPTQLTFPKPPAVPPPYYSGGNGNGGKSSQTETVAAAGDVAALMNQSQLSGLMLGPPAAAKVPFLIGVAGGGASGKSQVCQSIMNSIQNVLETNKKLRVFTIRYISIGHLCEPA